MWGRREAGTGQSPLAEPPQPVLSAASSSGPELPDPSIGLAEAADRACGDIAAPAAARGNDAVLEATDVKSACRADGREAGTREQVRVEADATEFLSGNQRSAGATGMATAQAPEWGPLQELVDSEARCRPHFFHSSF